MTRRSRFLAPPAPVAPGLAIGLLGGSFNPAHDGHRYISEVALKRLGLDYVWWLVSPQNPLKPEAGMAPLAARLASARTVGNHPRIRVMDIEHRLGTRYTVDTIKALRHRFPQTDFVWLMGSDNLAGFHRWRNWQQIAAQIPIAVVTRPGTVLAPLTSKAAQCLSRNRVISHRDFARRRPPALIILDGPRNPASATAIRAAGRTHEALECARPPC